MMDKKKMDEKAAAKRMGAGGRKSATAMKTKELMAASIAAAKKHLKDKHEHVAG